MVPRALALGVLIAMSNSALAEPPVVTGTVAATPELWAAWGGTVGVRWNRDLAADIGITFEAPTSRLDGLSEREHERFDLRQAGSLEFRVANNNLQAFAGGSLQAASAIFINSPGVKTPSTSSEPTRTSAPRELRPV